MKLARRAQTPPAVWEFEGAFSKILVDNAIRGAESSDAVSARWNAASACDMALGPIAFCRTEVRKSVGALLKTAWHEDDAIVRERRS